jgi:hypothetical protein
MFPGMPIDRDKSYDTPLGRFDSRIYLLRTSAEYMVVYTDFALNLEEDTQELDKILDKIRDSAVANSKAKVLSETKISLDGHPGRMMKTVEPNGNIARTKMYAVGNRLYQITITTPKETLTPDEGRFNESRAAKFLDSFKLTKPESTKTSGSNAPESPPPPAIEYNANAWKEYSSPQGQFTVMLPGTPTESDKSFDTPYGRAEAREYVLRTSAYYSIFYTIFPFDIERKPEVLNRFLNNTRDNSVTRINGKVLVETDISLDGHPGRMMKVATPDGTIIRSKKIAVGNRLYQIIVATPKELLAPDSGLFDESRATKFLDSFKLAKPEDSRRVN